MKIVKNGKSIKAFRPKFFIQKNIAFSNTNKIVNNFLIILYNIFLLFLIVFIEVQQLFYLPT